MDIHLADAFGQTDMQVRISVHGQAVSCISGAPEHKGKGPSMVWLPASKIWTHNLPDMDTDP